MKDSCGRVIDYMRISITDRCNLRCRYCMPEGVECVEPKNILTFEEILAAAACGAGLGIRHIKVTGGEPLVRKDCCRLIQMLKAVPGIEKVTITTNGVLLENCLKELQEAGIDGINISLDTMDRETYRQITGSDCLPEVLRAVRLASDTGIPVKINAVSLDLGDGWKEVVRLAESLPVDVRFIEMMPIGYGKSFPVINHQKLLEEMRECYPGMQRDSRIHGFGPAVYYRIPGFQGSIGFISAVHGKFCDSCNRVRLTAQGYLKTCLCYEDGVDLRKILREGQPEQEGRSGHWKWQYEDCPDDRALQERLRAAVSRAIREKPAAHCFERPGQITEAHNMIDIGG